MKKKELILTSLSLKAKKSPLKDSRAVVQLHIKDYKAIILLLDGGSSKDLMNEEAYMQLGKVE